MYEKYIFCWEKIVKYNSYFPPTGKVTELIQNLAGNLPKVISENNRWKIFFRVKILSLLCQKIFLKAQF